MMSPATASRRSPTQCRPSQNAPLTAATAMDPAARPPSTSPVEPLSRECGHGHECRIVAFELLATPRMAHLVRRWATALLGDWDVATDEAGVVLGELTANAVAHGGQRMTVRVHRHRDTTEIEVTDTGSDQVLPDLLVQGRPDDDTDALHGRGLPIVRCLSYQMSLTRLPDGSTRALAILKDAP
ncbi:ATP-binding protein [Kitasatospora indigofera]|uniref:ATP-binding protein n=2 Tax=Kitasatospora indigofera TaxID=67307 RepID=UPI0036C1FDBE